jgi:hypothetical protein
LFFVFSSLNPFRGTIASEYIGQQGVIRIGPYSRNSGDTVLDSIRCLSPKIVRPISLPKSIRRPKYSHHVPVSTRTTLLPSSVASSK